MANAGFFRGTSTEQDSRYFNQNKKLLAKLTFPKCFAEKVDLKKVNTEVINQWIAEKITELLGFEDEIVIAMTINLLDTKVDDPLDPREIQLALAGFLTKDVSSFMQELWDLLLSAQAHPTGIPPIILERKRIELEKRAVESEKVRQIIKKKNLRDVSEQKILEKVNQRRPSPYKSRHRSPSHERKTRSFRRSRARSSYRNSSSSSSSSHSIRSIQSRERKRSPSRSRDRRRRRSRSRRY